MTVPVSLMPTFFLLTAHAEEPVSLMGKIVESNVLNFLLVVLLLTWIFKKVGVIALLDKQKAKIAQELADAEARKAQALKELADIEKQTQNLSQETSRILSEAETTGAQMAASLIESAEQEAQKLLENAEKRIALEEKRLVRELEERLVREAVHGAREMLSATLSDQDRERSVSDFIQVLPQLAHSQGGAR